MTYSAEYEAAIEAIVAKATPLTLEQVSGLRFLLSDALAPSNWDETETPSAPVLARHQAIIAHRQRMHGAAIPGVYFIASTDGLVKIGHSQNVRMRRSGLQTASGRPLSILHVIHEPDLSRREQLESHLHEMFSDLRESGEWFRRTIRIDNYVESICAEECGFPK